MRISRISCVGRLQVCWVAISQLERRLCQAEEFHVKLVVLRQNKVYVDFTVCRSCSAQTYVLNLQLVKPLILRFFHQSLEILTLNFLELFRVINWSHKKICKHKRVKPFV